MRQLEMTTTLSRCRLLIEETTAECQCCATSKLLLSCQSIDASAVLEDVDCAFDLSALRCLNPSTMQHSQLLSSCKIKGLSVQAQWLGLMTAEKERGLLNHKE